MNTIIVVLFIILTYTLFCTFLIVRNHYLLSRDIKGTQKAFQEFINDLEAERKRIKEERKQDDN